MGNDDYERGRRDGRKEQLDIQQAIQKVAHPTCILHMVPEGRINGKCERCGEQVNGPDGKPLA
jgi:hypothetical protein